MKKYWKSVLIVLVILLSISTFYISSALSAGQHPEFTIHKQSGEEQEIDSLVLEGAYQPSPSSSSLLKITADEAAYRSQSGAASLIASPPAMIQELQEEHRAFMRGKSPSINSYFENNVFLAYAETEFESDAAGIHDFTFAVSLLEKNDGSITSAHIEVPDSAKYDWISVEDVQMIDHKLVLITQNMFFHHGKHMDEKHKYTIDLASQKITSSEPIISVSEGQQDNSSVSVRLVPTNPMQANDYLILLKSEAKASGPEEVTEEIQEIISYNLLTKEKEAINLPEGLQLEEHDISFFDGSTIYFAKQDNQQVTITPYSIIENQTQKEIKLNFSPAKKEAQLPMITVKDGKLYAVSSFVNTENNGKIAVVDLQTSETVYTGELAANNPLEKEQELYIYSMYVE